MAARFCIVGDGDGHSFLIPAERRGDWTLDEGDEEEVPTWAKPIDGPHRLTFTDPKEE